MCCLFIEGFLFFCGSPASGDLRRVLSGVGVVGGRALAWVERVLMMVFCCWASFGVTLLAAAISCMVFVGKVVS